MMNSDNNSIYIDDENRVYGFEPLRFVKHTAKGPILDIGTKKLWFRLRYPSGHIVLRTLSLTEESSEVEARMFLSAADTVPSFTAMVKRSQSQVSSGLYVDAAKHDAVSAVLDEAGFTLRFGSGNAPVVTVVPEVVKPVPNVQEVAKVVTKVIEDVKIETPTATVKVDSEPVHHAKMLDEIPISVENKEEIVDVSKIPVEKTTPVEDLCRRLRIEEARDYIIDSGPCKGWTVAQTLARRRSSVVFFASSGYKGDDNILRACSKIVLEDETKKLAS